MTEFQHFPPPNPQEIVSFSPPVEASMNIILHEKSNAPEIGIELGTVYEHAGNAALTGAKIETSFQRDRRVFSEGFGISIGVPEDTAPEVPVPVRDKPYILDAAYVSAYIDDKKIPLGAQRVMIAHGYINNQGEWTLRDGRLVPAVVHYYNEKAKQIGMPTITALGICQDSPDQAPPSSEYLDGITYIAGSNIIVGGAKDEQGEYEVSLRSESPSGRLKQPETALTELELYASMLSEKEQDIFAPFEPKKAKSETLDELVESLMPSQNKYDKLYDSQYDNSNTGTQRARAGSSEILDRKPTEESLQFGEQMLAQVKDSITLDIIQKRASELLSSNATPENVMRMIREDKQVRYQLAVSILRKLDSFVESGSALLPPRVGRKGEVKAPHRFYGKNTTMPSRDYVACIALSFIDGSFDPKQTDILALERGFDPEVGEHRYTAAGLLTNHWPHSGA